MAPAGPAAADCGWCTSVVKGVFQSEGRATTKGGGERGMIVRGTVPTHRSFLVSLLMATLFFAWQAPALDERGWTIDETETAHAGRVDLQFLRALSDSERWLPALTTLSRGFGRELGWHELTA